MQNRYVADVGDFGKYGLLRYLCRDLRLAVVWYLVADEGHNSDGRHIRYLGVAPEALIHYSVRPTTMHAASQNARRYRACDEELYDALSDIVAERRRTIVDVRKSGILPRNTLFFEEPLTLRPDAPLHERRRQRENWVKAALTQTADCDVVFLDPDNGLEVPSHGVYSKVGPKYVAYEEAQRFIARGQSLIIYQHSDRAPELVGRRRVELASRLAVGADDIHALQYHRGTARVFFVIPAAQQAKVMSERLDAFMVTPWREQGLFSLA